MTSPLSGGSLIATLESALQENPDDLATLSALADALSELDDPRGEFIQTQLALEQGDLSPQRRDALRQREQTLLTAHARTWLGELAPYLLDQQDMNPWGHSTGQEYRHRFARGWLASVSMPFLSDETARILARASAARLLRELIIEGDCSLDDHPHGSDLPEGAELANRYPLLQAPFLPNLRLFQIGETPNEQDHEEFDCLTFSEGVIELVSRMHRVEELHFFTHGVDLGSLFTLPTLTQLRVLRVYHLHEHPLSILADNPAFQNLTHLLIHPGRFDRTPNLLIHHVRAILWSPNLPRLTHLQLRVHDLGDTLCSALVDSGILNRLRFLDLQHGTITDGGAFILSLQTQAGLQLNVTDNALTENGLAMLRNAGVDLIAEGQHEPGCDDWRYQADIE